MLFATPPLKTSRRKGQNFPPCVREVRRKAPWSIQTLPMLTTWRRAWKLLAFNRTLQTHCKSSPVLIFCLTWKEIARPSFLEMPRFAMLPTWRLHRPQVAFSLTTMRNVPGFSPYPVLLAVKGAVNFSSHCGTKLTPACLTEDMNVDFDEDQVSKWWLHNRTSTCTDLVGWEDLSTIFWSAQLLHGNEVVPWLTFEVFPFTADGQLWRWLTPGVVPLLFTCVVPCRKIWGALGQTGDGVIIFIITIRRNSLRFGTTKACNRRWAT